MTRKEAYAVAAKLAFIDFAPQWVLRRVQEPNQYTVLSVAAPEDVVSYLWIVENYLDPKSQEDGVGGWMRAHNE